MATFAVLGASGSVGSKVVKVLSKIPSATVRAVVRDTGAAKSTQLVEGTPNVSLVAGSMSDVASLDAALVGVDAVFINTPGSEDRTALSTNALQAAKRAGVKHVVVVSFSNADTTTEVFGRQGSEIEAATKAAGSPYTVLRLPFFLDNIWGNAGSIKGQSKIYSSQAPAARGGAISTDDVGDVAGVILSEGPAKHGGKTYNINNEPWSQAELAAAFSKSLGRTVDYVQVPEAGVSAALAGFGMQPWQVEGCLELLRRIDAGTYNFPSDVPAILGRPATTMEAYVQAIAGSGAF